MKVRTPCFDGERGSRKIKRRKEYEESNDDGMWLGKKNRGENYGTCQTRNF